MKSDWQANFSHLYAEPGCLDTELGAQLAERFSRATIVEIDDYKNVFNRPGQDFRQQKRAVKLIVARKREPLIYDGSPFAPAFGHPHFYYNVPIVNCVYNCDYCYLQGMYRSANLVVYVNQDDMAAAADQVLAKCGSIYLCVSYDTDLLAFENVLPLSRYWMNWASNRENALIELRTKSANYRAVADLPVNDASIIAWTLSPTEIAAAHEAKTAPTRLRIEAMAAALADGRRVRLCIDPILHVPDWQTHYADLVDQLRNALDLSALHDVSLGTFRMNKDYLRSMQRLRPDASVLYHPFENQGTSAAYPAELRSQLLDFVASRITKTAPNLTVNCFQT